MPTSSRSAICGDSIVPSHRANEPPAATGNGAQADARPRVADDLSYSLNRFLDKSKETAHGYQRPPLGFGKVQCDAEAEIEAETRIRRELRAFDDQFFGAISAGKQAH
ncbi:hypothetical protein ACSS6W_005681 [Trichoderma asperelloides]